MYLGFLIIELPVIAAISAILYLPFYFVGKRRSGAKPFVRHLACYALIGYMLSLIFLTLLWYWPDITFRPEWYFLNLQPFVWLTKTYEMGAQKMVEQLVLNIGMFVPLGLLLPIVFEKMRVWWKTILAALAVTLCIETLQYFMGRSADIDDVIMNFTGGVLGYLLFAAFQRCFGRLRFWQLATGRGRTDQNA